MDLLRQRSCMVHDGSWPIGEDWQDPATTKYQPRAMLVLPCMHQWTLNHDSIGRVGLHVN